MRERILIVDDEEIILRLLEKILKNEGYTCVTAANASEARSQLKRDPFDLLLTDIRMPGESGIELAGYVKDRCPETPVVIISGMDDRVTTQRAIELGVFGYLIKPFENGQVMITVANALRRGALEKKETRFKNRLQELVQKQTAELHENLAELENTQKALKESEEHFRNVVEHVNDGISIIQGEIQVYANRRYLEILGYKSAKDAIGHSISEHLHPDDRQRVLDTSLRRQRGEMVPDRYRFRCIRKDGAVIHIEVSSTRTLCRGKPASLSILRDVTEETRAEEALIRKTDELAENRERLLKALEEISLLIQKVAREKDFGIRFENPYLSTCYEIMKCSEDKCPIYGKGRTRCWQTMGTFCGGVVQGTFSQKVEVCFDCAVFQKSCLDPFCEIGEHFNNMMHILEAKNLQLQQANQELKETQSLIIQQEKMASIGQLAAGVAHEINNPTGFINSNLGTLLDYQKDLFPVIDGYRNLLSRLDGIENNAALPDSIINQIEYIRRLEKESDIEFIKKDLPDLIEESREGTERIKKIVLDLKDFAHPGKRELVYTDLNRSLDSTLNIVWNEIKYKATVTKEYGNIPQVQCYPQQLNQVFMNVLVNAAQAIEQKGEITIKTRENNGSVEIRISDTGKGMPQNILTKIFEPFFTTKEVGKGTGLGLHMAYNIIKKHNGKITVNSTQGRGTTFIIDIPIDARGEESHESLSAAG